MSSAIDQLTAGLGGTAILSERPALHGSLLGGAGRTADAQPVAAVAESRALTPGELTKHARQAGSAGRA